MKSIICYIPNPLSESNINYICSDNKVHIRFRDYDSEGTVAGFEQKLTYLISYLMNYSYLTDLIPPYNDNDAIKDFLKSSDLAEINSCIRSHTGNLNYRGIKLRKNYKKKDLHDYKSFGSVNINCFPILPVESVRHRGSLKTFLSTFKISLDDYLFNDNYVISIQNIDLSKVNTKFINKMNKKEEAMQRENMVVASLW